MGRRVLDGNSAIATRARRGRAVLAGLAHWAVDHDIGDLYLQVERDNVAALRLYEAASFTEVCAYHYRTLR